MDEDTRYRRARERVAALRGFYTHLAFFILVNAGLLAINLLASPGTWWFYWPLLGWGIGLGAHAISVFGRGALLGPKWEQRKIRDFMERDRSRSDEPSN